MHCFCQDQMAYCKVTSSQHRYSSTKSLYSAKTTTTQMTSSRKLQPNTRRMSRLAHITFDIPFPVILLESRHKVQIRKNRQWARTWSKINGSSRQQVLCSDDCRWVKSTCMAVRIAFLLDLGLSFFMPSSLCFVIGALQYTW